MSDTIVLTDEQHTGVQMASDAFSKGKHFSLGGYAGTGKSTMMKDLIEMYPDAGVCAYTGKAAEVLRRKGIPKAGTIHSLIYTYDPSSDKFYLKEPEDVPYDGFFIDEASMVGGDIYKDLLSFGVPIIAIGDPGQLPPVSPSDLNLVEDPDYCLETIHRQEAGSGVLTLAHHIRHGGRLHAGLMHADNVGILSKTSLSNPDTWVHHDIVICGKNKTRQRFNKLARSHRGISGGLAVGEPLICLQNDKERGWFNGAQATVEFIENSIIRPPNKFVDQTVVTNCIIKWDGGRSENIPILTSHLGKKAPDWRIIRNLKCCSMDFAYCITCHKSQGSEWDRVAIIREEAPALWEQKRWDYTAITRAAKEVRVFV